MRLAFLGRDRRRMWSELNLLAGFVCQRSAQVTLASAAADGDDELALVLGTPGGLQRRPDVGTGGDAGQDAFFEREASSGYEGVFVADGDDVVHDLQIQVCGNESGAGALNPVRAGLERHAVARLSDDRGVFRLDGDGLEGFLAELDDFADARDRAARADGGHKNIRFAFGVGPDFLGSSLPVDFRIGGIVELLGHPGVGSFLIKLLSFLDGALHSLGTGRQDESGAQQGEQSAPLLAHGLGHREDDLVATRRRDERQRNAGVAGGGLDDGGLGRQKAVAFSGLDHGVADAVLDAAEWVEELGLQHDGRGRAIGDTIQLDQWGSSHGANDVLMYGHGYFSLFVLNYRFWA